MSSSRFTPGMRASVWSALLAFAGLLMVNVGHAQSISADQRGAISDHVRKCYSGAPEDDKFRVLLTVLTDEAGTARRAVVADENQSKLGDPRFRAFAERAVRAVLNARCANLPLPKTMLGRQATITFRFIPHDPPQQKQAAAQHWTRVADMTGTVGVYVQDHVLRAANGRAEALFVIASPGDIPLDVHDVIFTCTGYAQTMQPWAAQATPVSPGPVLDAVQKFACK